MAQNKGSDHPAVGEVGLWLMVSVHFNRHLRTHEKRDKTEWWLLSVP